MYFLYPTSGSPYSALEMEYKQTAPTCIVTTCDNVSALSSVASDQFFNFRTFYCSDCHQKLRDGEDLAIDTALIIVERNREPD